MIRKAIVIPKYKFIFIEIPKGASGSIKDAIARSLGIKPDSEQYIKWRKGIIPLIDLDSDEYKGYFKFAFVRNPYSRLVSGYYNHVLNINREYSPGVKSLIGSRLPKVVRRLAPIRKFLGKKDISFDDFIYYLCRTPDDKLNVHWRPQHTFISKKRFLRRKIYPDFIGRVENIENDWKKICKKVGLDVKIQHEGKSRHPSYKKCYSKDTWKMVSRRYKESIELLGYQNITYANDE